MKVWETISDRVRSDVGEGTQKKLGELKKRMKVLFLRGRSFLAQVEDRSCELGNLYHACVQKTGSQWIRAVVSDPRFRSASGLETFPQFRYEWGEFCSRFPSGTYVPGLYISRGLYEEIEKPEHYKTLYVLRDPRDIVVSWYHSMRETHGLMGKVGKHRRKLQEMDLEEGLAYCIKAFHLKCSFMRGWIYEKDDRHTLFVKLEDLSANPVDEFERIVEHCGIPLSRGELESILQDYTKEKMRERDREERETDRSHYREDPDRWYDVFTARHRELFRKVNGNLVELLGYES